jgi:hypothetical protein
MKLIRPFVWRISLAAFVVVLLTWLPLGAVPRQDAPAMTTAADAYRAEKLARLRGERFVCGTTIDGSMEDRHLEELARHERNLKRLERLRRQGFQPEPAQTGDIGDIAVIEDHGTLVIPANLLDLQGQTLTYAPNAAGGYDSNASVQSFDGQTGDKLTQFTGGSAPLDDGYAQVDFPEGFRFTFYGVTYDRVFVGTNGYLTFRRGDIREVPTLSRFLLPFPRIALVWNDFDLTPIANSTSAGIFAKQLTDRLVVTYRNVSLINQITQRNTIQVTLFADGRITVNYFRVQALLDGYTGITPGTSGVARNEVNFSEPQTGLTGAIYEIFRGQTEADVFGVPDVFYDTHEDNFDFIYVWTDFNFDLGNAFAFYSGIRNVVRGIGLNQFDRGASFGSPQRLQGLLVLNNIVSAYPANPNDHSLGLNSALSILGQEQGHRWLSFIGYTGSDPSILRGRQQAHWSFFYNTESTSASSSPEMPRSSSVEGNVWRENGNGTFSTPANELVDGFSALDQYIMGLRAPQEVPDSFVIRNPTLGLQSCYGDAPEGRDCGPRRNVTTGGTRMPVSIDQVIAANGPRVPGVETSQKVFRTAFILLTTRPPAQSTLDKLNLYRTAWVEYFFRATDGRGQVDTRLSN